VDKTRDRDSRTARLRKGGRTEARSLAMVELHLESTEDRYDADPMEPLLDRAALRRAVEELSDRLVPEGTDEWLDSPTDARLLVGQDRLLLRLALPAESRDQLANRLDRLFDLSFDLASALRLEVVDPQMGSVVTRFRYEQSFQRILDVYYTRARTAAALASSPAGWTEFATDGVAGAKLPAIETEPDSVPAAVWSVTKRPLGVLEFAGERALAALAALDPAAPFLAIVPRDVEPGDDAAVLRVKRLVHPVPGLALVEVSTEGASRIGAVERGESLLLQLVPREK
jgi:hypothetical protein